MFISNCKMPRLEHAIVEIENLENAGVKMEIDHIVERYINLSNLLQKH